MLESNVIKNYFYTYLTYGISLVSTLGIYYLISLRYDVIEFEKYNLSRRVVGIISVILMLGFAVSLPKAIATNNCVKLRSVLIVANVFSSLFFIIILTSIFAVLVTLFSDFFGNLFWGTILYEDLIIIISFYVISLAAFNIVFSFARGLMDLKVANIMTLSNSVLPILFLPYFSKIEHFYLAFFVTNVFLALFFLYFILHKHNFFYYFSYKIYLRQFKKMFYFGIPRVPGDFALEGILSLPVFITAHLSSTRNASNLGFAITLISMIGTLTSPISVILLPYSSKLISSKKIDELKKHVNLILFIFAPAAILLTVIFWVFSKNIVKIYLGNFNEDISTSLSFVSVVFLPYTIYMIVRSVNDSYYNDAVNTKNTLYSLSALIFSTLFFNYVYSCRFSSMIGLYVGIFSLGITSFCSFRKIFKL